MRVSRLPLRIQRHIPRDGERVARCIGRAAAVRLCVPSGEDKPARLHQRVRTRKDDGRAAAALIEGVGGRAAARGAVAVIGHGCLDVIAVQAMPVLHAVRRAGFDLYGGIVSFQRVIPLAGRDRRSVDADSGLRIEIHRNVHAACARADRVAAVVAGSGHGSAVDKDLQILGAHSACRGAAADARAVMGGNCGDVSAVDGDRAAGAVGCPADACGPGAAESDDASAVDREMNALVADLAVIDGVAAADAGGCAGSVDAVGRAGKERTGAGDRAVSEGSCINSQRIGIALQLDPVRCGQLRSVAKDKLYIAVDADAAFDGHVFVHRIPAARHGFRPNGLIGDDGVCRKACRGAAGDLCTAERRDRIGHGVPPLRVQGGICGDIKRRSRRIVRSGAVRLGVPAGKRLVRRRREGAQERRNAAAAAVGVVRIGHGPRAAVAVIGHRAGGSRRFQRNVVQTDTGTVFAGYASGAEGDLDAGRHRCLRQAYGQIRPGTVCIEGMVDGHPFAAVDPVADTEFVVRGSPHRVDIAAADPCAAIAAQVHGGHDEICSCVFAVSVMRDIRIHAVVVHGTVFINALVHRPAIIAGCGRRRPARRDAAVFKGLDADDRLKRRPVGVCRNGKQTEQERKHQQAAEDSLGFHRLYLCLSKCRLAAGSHPMAAFLQTRSNTVRRTIYHFLL